MPKHHGSCFNVTTAAIALPHALEPFNLTLLVFTIWTLEGLLRWQGAIRGACISSALLHLLSKAQSQVAQGPPCLAWGAVAEGVFITGSTWTDASFSGIKLVCSEMVGCSSITADVSSRSAGLEAMHTMLGPLWSRRLAQILACWVYAQMQRRTFWFNNGIIVWKGCHILCHNRLACSRVWERMLGWNHLSEFIYMSNEHIEIFWTIKTDVGFNCIKQSYRLHKLPLKRLHITIPFFWLPLFCILSEDWSGMSICWQLAKYGSIALHFRIGGSHGSFKPFMKKLEEQFHGFLISFRWALSTVLLDEVRRKKASLLFWRQSILWKQPIPSLFNFRDILICTGTSPHCHPSLDRNHHSGGEWIAPCRLRVNGAFECKEWAIAGVGGKWWETYAGLKT